MNQGSALLIPALVATLGCEKALSPEAKAAQDAAKTAEARVAALEQQLADVKAGKHTAPDGSAEDVKHVSKAQQKALERQLADAKRKAEAKKQEAQQLAQQPAPKEAPKPAVVDLPTGTMLTVKLVQDLATDKQQAGDAWQGTLAQDVTIGGQVVWPAGKTVRGLVTQSTPAGRLASGKGGLAIKLTEVGDVDVDTDTHVVVGDARGERNTKMIGGGAALGALVGLLSDKRNQGDHALGGAAIGAAVGTAVAAGTADTVIRIKADTPVTFTLAAPEKVTLRK